MRQRVNDALARDAFAGALILGAAVLALIVANSPWAADYYAVLDYTFGPEALHLNLTVGQWAADGLLAIFFFVVGLELKYEFVAGALRNPRIAAVPVAAAVGGVIAPGIIYILVNLSASGEALRGWAIPAATDIAFAVAVLAVVGRNLPSALRTFLLTLAVVDDLLAITIIAVFYTDDLSFAALIAAMVPLALFTLAVQNGYRQWWLLLPLAAATWTLVHASGIHATVAGVLLGFVVPVRPTKRARVELGPDDNGSPQYEGLSHHFAARWTPISSGFAVPVFAFFAAGVTIGGVAGLVETFQSSVAVGIVAGLVIGKFVGITATSAAITRLPGIRLDTDIKWPDLIGLSFVAGIGFTVSLLVGELAFGAHSEQDDFVKIAVLVGSLIAATIGAIILRWRSRIYAVT